MIDVCKNKYKDINFKIGDAEKIDFKNDYFDILITSEAFHHFPNPEKSLKEFKRVAKKDGIIVLCDMYRPTPVRQFMNFMFNFTNTGDIKMYNKKEIMNLINNSGLKIKEKKYYYSSFIYYLENEKN